MTQSIVFKASVRQILADMETPVSMYARLRDRFPGSILLESTDYQPDENCYSYICFDPIAGFTVSDGEIREYYPDGTELRKQIAEPSEVLADFQDFFGRFKVEQDPKHQFIKNGLFGYSAYDAIEYFEDIRLSQKESCCSQIPRLSYHVFRYVIAVNHYKHETYLLENQTAGMPEAALSLKELEHLLRHSEIPRYPFERLGEGSSDFTDEEHLGMIGRCKEHIYRGDIFQIVPSRRFAQAFRGDEFNVYRALRAINPSPYLFFYDCGGFKIFGSSPEAELIVDGRKASIYPIAGTCPRSGDQERDEAAVRVLERDPKENAEHVMLVDLARNDLSKHCLDVRVERFREVHWYSHVVHLVSVVSGQMNAGVDAINLLADTFPAGTLSGAPKYRAMELIDAYERGRRGFYGGAIGFFGFDGSCNHAIMIRTFLSKDGVLYRQAGGGVVADSDPHKEVEEVSNKLKALEQALRMAEEM